MRLKRRRVRGVGFGTTGQRRFTLEVAVLAAALAGLAPWLVWHALERMLPALSLTLAAPASTTATTLETAVGELRTAAPVAIVEPAPRGAVAALWAGVHGETSPPPLLLDVQLWPALAVDEPTLRAAVQARLPDAVVEAGPAALPRPWGTLPLAAAWAGLVVTLAWQVRRGLRRALARRRDALVLLVAFGGRPERIDALVASPLRRRATFGAAIGGLLGAAMGLGTLVATQPLPIVSLSQHPWNSVPTAALLTVVLATAGVRMLARRVLATRLARAAG